MVINLLFTEESKHASYLLETKYLDYITILSTVGIETYILNVYFNSGYIYTSSFITVGDVSNNGDVSVSYDANGIQLTFKQSFVDKYAAILTNPTCTIAYSSIPITIDSNIVLYYLENTVPIDLSTSNIINAYITDGNTALRNSDHLDLHLNKLIGYKKIV